MNKTHQFQSARNRAHRHAAGRRLPGLVAALAPLAVAVSFASIGYAPAVQAQAGATSHVELEEITVTARRREENVQDVPIAITALSGDFLREQNITELNQLGIFVPSLRISNAGFGTSTPLVTLRGQRPSDIGLTVDPAIPLYFAEIPVTPAQGTNLAMYDLANVQVLKGPQGTLFGRNSTGGALLFTPRTPGEEYGGYAEARIGDYDLFHFEGAADLPVSDTLAFRVAARKIDRDGYQENVAANPLNGEQPWDEDSYGLRLVTRWTPTERLQNLTTISYDNSDTLNRVPVPAVYNSNAGLAAIYNFIHNGALGGLAGTPVGAKIDEALARQKGRDWQDVESDIHVSDQIENWFVANATEFELSDSLKIKNIFGYRDLEESTNVDADGMAVPLFGARTSLTENFTRDPELDEITAEQYSDELQLLGTAFDQRLEWIVGAFWMRMEGSEYYPNQISGPNPDWPAAGSGLSAILDTVALNGANQLSPNIDVENEAWALFGEGTWSFSEQWSATLGLRQSWDDRAMTAMNYSTDFRAGSPTLTCFMYDENDQSLANSGCARDVDESFDKLSWRSSLNYSPTDDMLLYASVATGYRTGGLNSRGTDNFTLQPFKEETVLTYEIGHKTDWQLFDLATMRTNLAIYLQQYDDIQKSVSSTNPRTGSFDTFVVNAAEAEIRGVEFDILIAPVESLAISLGWSWVDAEHKEWDREVSPGVFVDYSQSEFLYIPENTLSGSLSWTLPLDPSIGEVSFVATGYWQDEMATNDDPWRWPSLGWSQENLDEALASAVIDDYSVWNFRLDWRGVQGSKFDLSVYVNNATDEDYITGGLSVPEDLGLVANTYGEPRTYGASLRYTY